MKKELQEAFKETKAYYCLECGKCTGNCPITEFKPGYSPRLMVKRVALGFDDDVVNDPDIWECLTCNMCYERCRSGVHLPEFVRAVRAEASDIGNLGTCSHSGMFQSLMKLMTSPKLKQKRLKWTQEYDNLKFRTEPIKKSDDNEIMLFTGCAPYFDSIFKDMNVKSTAIISSAIRIMNHLGITPIISKKERCCGHDMLWTGEIETFQKLAKLNIENIKKLGVKTIIVTCPEGYHTLKSEYPKYFGATDGIWEEAGIEILHITEFVADKIKSGDLKLDELKVPGTNGHLKLTYHDPCRLGRFAGIYDAPREILNAIPGVELVEMDRNRHLSLCCGVNSWTNCDSISKQIRAEKLSSAKNTEASKLITSCPKCQIHLKCYTNNEYVEPKIDIDIEDIIVFLANAMSNLEE
jgi:Fe-S oxidoreductase